MRLIDADELIRQGWRLERHGISNCLVGVKSLADVPTASYLGNDKCTEKRVAREILSIIEMVCFTDEFFEYRVNQGSNGTRDLIIKLIKESYEIG